MAQAIEYIENEKVENERALERLENDRRLRAEQDKAYAAAVKRDEGL